MMIFEVSYKHSRALDPNVSDTALLSSYSTRHAVADIECARRIDDGSREQFIPTMVNGIVEWKSAFDGRVLTASVRPIQKLTGEEVMQAARELGRSIDRRYIIKPRGREIDLVVGESIVATWTQQD